MLVLFVLLTAISDYSFNKRVEREKEALTSGIDGTKIETFTYDDLEGLPEPVQRYFRYAITEGQDHVKVVRLKHTGWFRTDVDKNWFPVKGEQAFTTDTPAFIWYAKLKMNPLVWVKARDSYFEGKGNMHIKIYSTITIADEKGKELDQSSFLRWLGEAPWFPTALLPSEKLQWEEIDTNSARVVVKSNNLNVSAIFYFNNEGQITSFVTKDRFRTVDGEQVNEHFTGYYKEYQEKNGFMIPTEIEAVWNLNTGDYSYAKFTVVDIQYDTHTKS